MKIQRKHNKVLTPRAKELRKDMTPEEKHLWYDYLQRYPIRIRRQKVIDCYIADFYCHDAMLVIEIDGYHHFTAVGKQSDENRTYVIENRNIKVIRFTNNEVTQNFEYVCARIDEEIKSRVKNENPSVSHTLDSSP